MCGIAGFIDNLHNRSSNHNRSILASMGDAISDRGPDGAGVWYDDIARVGFSHRRLSILDISDAGHQPMISRSGRYVIIFNGEIYNHEDLKSNLDCVPWRGHSDTEVLLECIDLWGIRKTLDHSVGMFAIALWDRKHYTLTLARDRLGEKPLYYGIQNGVFLFASEIKSLKRHPSFESKICENGLGYYSALKFIPSPYSIYRNIYKLPPGTFIEISNSTVLPEPEAYWDLNNIVNTLPNYSLNLSEEDTCNEFERTLRKSVKEQLVADVPLGAFLSGGIDSSLITTIMQQESKTKVKTFTIGFNEDGFNEATHAKKVAMYLGTEHHEEYISAKKALEFIPNLSSIYDEPFADDSQIPSYFLSQMARKKVTVALSGDGGDELLHGYSRHLFIPRVLSMPAPLRLFLGQTLSLFSRMKIERLYKLFSDNQCYGDNLNHKFQKLVKIMHMKSFNEMYFYLLGESAQNILRTTDITLDSIIESKIRMNLGNRNKVVFADTILYLPDDIFVKVDRASMANSLEVRTPFADHRLVELSWRLPDSMKIKNGVQKWITRQILAKYLPTNLQNNEKKGFDVPISDWLRGPLRGWAEDLLSEKKLKEDGFFDHKKISYMWNMHKANKYNWKTQLWIILMFQSWLKSERSK